MQDLPTHTQHQPGRPSTRATDPIFVLDSREFYRPVAIEAILEAPGVTVIDGLGKRSPLRSLDALPTTGRINLPTDPTKWSLPLQAKYGNVGYRRVVKQAGLWWHQYWTYWIHNPKKYLGRGEHESDLEFVQLGCTDEAGENPVLATASQHHSGGKREVWRMVRKTGRPVFYVARDSHANYFGPMNDVEDTADGRGLVLDQVEWRPFGDWAMWPGRWGNSDNSPKSPGHQGARWFQPAVFHGQAR